jgi:hypothetical protein
MSLLLTLFFELPPQLFSVDSLVLLSSSVLPASVLRLDAWLEEAGVVDVSRSLIPGAASSEAESLRLSAIFQNLNSIFIIKKTTKESVK